MKSNRETKSSKYHVDVLNYKKIDILFVIKHKSQKLYNCEELLKIIYQYYGCDCCCDCLRYTKGVCIRCCTGDCYTGELKYESYISYREDMFQSSIHMDDF